MTSTTRNRMKGENTSALPPSPPAYDPTAFRTNDCDLQQMHDGRILATQQTDRCASVPGPSTREERDQEQTKDLQRGAGREEGDIEDTLTEKQEESVNWTAHLKLMFSSCCPLQEVGPQKLCASEPSPLSGLSVTLGTISSSNIT